MKTYFIKASAPGPFKEYKKHMGAPPQNIFSVAACTPATVDVDMCDETVGMRPDMNTDADIVAIFFHTPDAIHAYKMADQYREKGYTVVLGGLHASFLPDEAAEHADALLIGEAEGIWEDLLYDFRAGRLQSRYERTEPVDMASLNPYPTDIIPPSRYNGVWSVLVSRGCVHRCEYCVIPPFFKGEYRLRPVEDVVAEIRNAPATWFELHADNLTANREYAIELFKTLKPLNITWMGESTLRMADDKELLRLAAESGCKYLLIGIETPPQAALNKSGKAITTPKDVRNRIRRFHAHGIQVTSSMIFGFDTHSQDIFRESLVFAREIEIDETESVLLAPFPGTPLHKRLSDEGRLLTHDWSLYDCANVTFTPKNMSVAELDKGSRWFWQKTNNSEAFSLFSKPCTPTSDEENSKPAASKQKTASKPTERTLRSTGVGMSFRWKTLLALPLVVASVLMNQYWLWGILFLLWGIRDIRTGSTYLVEQLERNRSPLLFWTIAVMWIAMGFWSLSTAPVFERFLGPGLPASSAASFQGEDTLPAATGATASTEKLPATQTVKAYESGMRINIPDSWEVTRIPIPDGHQVDMEAPRHRATMTYADFDLGTRLKHDEFVKHMEREIQDELPAVRPDNGKTITIKPAAAHDMEIVFKEYKGSIEGEPITAIAGYGMRGERGYLILAVHGAKDESMRAAIMASFESLVLEKR